MNYDIDAAFTLLAIKHCPVTLEQEFMSTIERLGVGQHILDRAFRALSVVKQHGDKSVDISRIISSAVSFLSAVATSDSPTEAKSAQFSVIANIMELSVTKPTWNPEEVMSLLATSVRSDGRWARCVAAWEELAACLDSPIRWVHAKLAVVVFFEICRHIPAMSYFDMRLTVRAHIQKQHLLTYREAVMNRPTFGHPSAIQTVLDMLSLELAHQRMRPEHLRLAVSAADTILQLSPLRDVYVFVQSPHEILVRQWQKGI